MTPHLTVWEWNQYSKWRMFLGTSAQSAADQVRRALSAYQPQNFYGVYGARTLYPAFEITWAEYSARGSWGFVPDVETAWITMYALSKILRNTVLVGSHAMPGHSVQEITNAMPDFARFEMASKYRTLNYS